MGPNDKKFGNHWHKLLASPSDQSGFPFLHYITKQRISSFAESLSSKPVARLYHIRLNMLVHSASCKKKISDHLHKENSVNILPGLL